MNPSLITFTLILGRSVGLFLENISNKYSNIQTILKTLEKMRQNTKARYLKFDILLPERPHSTHQ